MAASLRHFVLCSVLVAGCDSDAQLTGKVIVEARPGDTGVPDDTDPPDDTDDTDDTADSGDTGPTDDLDGDGYTEADGDCDDTEPAVNPGATETWYDGVDADCAGDSDYDADGDGFDSDAHAGDDCDDAEPAVNPAATDTWYDGVDADCGGNSDYDADGDGYDIDTAGGNDCVDTDPAIQPGATEVPENGVDEDCDPATPAFSGTLTLTDAAGTWTSTDSGFGSGVVILEDIDADGADGALAIGARYANPLGTSTDGAVWVWDGLPAGGTPATASATVSNPGEGGELGVRMRRLDDLDGDGIGELGLSQYSHTTDPGDGTTRSAVGTWHIVSGADLVADVDVTDSAQVFAYGHGAVDFHYFGFDHGTADLDGDGTADLYVGCADSTKSTAPEVVLFLSDSGPTPSGRLLPGDAGAVHLNGDDTDGYDRYGYDMGAGDVNGDGTDDLLVGAFESTECGADDAGAVFAHLGPIQAAETYADADTLCPNTPTEDLGVGVAVDATDLDGDGYAELIAGAWDSAVGAGHAYVWQGGATGLSASPVADLTAGEAGDRFGLYLDATGDLNGDGQADLAVFAPAAALASGQGKVHIYAGGVGFDDVVDVLVEVGSSGPDELGVGDIDLDGVDDLVAGTSLWVLGGRGWQP